MVTRQPWYGHPPIQGWSPFLAPFDTTWAELHMFGPVWPLAPFGPVWPRLAPGGPI